VLSGSSDAGPAAVQPVTRARAITGPESTAIHDLGM
jgi:hypothetical protein